MNLFSFLPTVLISRIVGLLVVLPAPRFLWRRVIQIYCRAYNVDLKQAEYPLEHYRNLAEFFTRNLKPGLRPVGPGIVSPIDGTLRNFGLITDDRLPQIKGKHYSVKDLLGDELLASEFIGGCFLNLYLSPRDYHHVHVPLGGSVRMVGYSPGRLLPVNDGSMGTIENLFGTNERVSIIIEDENLRTYALVMVGALNVGKISLTFDAGLSTRIRATPFFAGGGFVHYYAPGEKPLRTGDRLGTFHLGSSVALLFPKGFLPAERVYDEPRAILMGQSLTEIPEFRR